MPGRGRHAPRLPLRHRARRAPRRATRASGSVPLTEHLLGVRLQKGHGAADWSRRPLPDDWLTYAALDVELLIELRDAVAADLERQDKTAWAAAGVRGRAPRPSPAAARRAVASHLGDAQGAPARAARRRPRAVGVPRRARLRPRRRPGPPAARRRDRRRRPARARAPRGARRDAGVPRARPAPPGRSLVVGDRPRPRAGPRRSGPPPPRSPTARRPRTAGATRTRPPPRASPPRAPPSRASPSAPAPRWRTS